MGSVQDRIFCPHCKYPEAKEEYYYHSGEVWIFCDRCGFNLSVDRKIITERPTLKSKIVNRLLGEEPKKEIEWVITRKGGFGAYHHTAKRGLGTGGHFINKWSARKTIKLMKRYVKNPIHADETITYTKKLLGKWYLFDARTGERTLMEGTESNVQSA